ncbi:MAG: hypothetical protein KDD33_13510 [Bdellovibrionales bacterium]|nr:hypothetical protein [Bdellovibrionales bacterium]
MIRRFLLLCISMLISTSVLANVDTYKLQRGKFVAQAAANSLNQLNSVGDYLKWIEAFVPEKQVDAVRAYTRSLGISEADKFPQYSVSGNRMYYGQNYIQFNEDSIVVNGHRFEASNKPLPEIMQEICGKIGCKNKSRRVSLLEIMFIEEAHALAPVALFGIGAAVGGLATWLFSSPVKAAETGNNSSIWNQFLSNTLQIGTQFIAQELLGVGNGGYYECQNGQVYVVGRRGQVLNMFGLRGRRLQVPSHLLNSSQTCQQNVDAINGSIRINTNNGRITAPSGATRIDNSGAPTGATRITN